MQPQPAEWLDARADTRPSNLDAGAPVGPTWLSSQQVILGLSSLRCMWMQARGL